MSESNQTFKAWLFHPELGNEVIEGEVVVERTGVRFVSIRANDEIPADRIDIWFEGRDDDRIIFGDPTRPELKIFSDDGDVLRCRALAPLNEARERLTQVATRRELSRRVRILLYFFSGCLVLFWMASCSVSSMVNSIAKSVPPEWEQKFSEMQLAIVSEEGILRSNTPQVVQLTALARPLIEALPPGSGRDFRFFILEDDEPNAFALPNGYVVVHSGLIDTVDRPEELLGVLAHELAHVTLKHQARKTISSAGPLLIFGVFLQSRSGVGNVLAAGTGLMVYQGFSQEYETEADNAGWEYLLSARINPRGMITTFRKLRAYEAAHEMLAVPEPFQSHPALEKRIKRLERRWQKLPGQTDFIQVTNRLDDLKSR